MDRITSHEGYMVKWLLGILATGQIFYKIRYYTETVE